MLSLNILNLDKSCLEFIKVFSSSTQIIRLNEFLMLFNVKMPIIVGILTFISMINTTSESLIAREIYISAVVLLLKLHLILVENENSFITSDWV